MKSKKYEAAEKHFEKKEEKYRKEIGRYIDRIVEMRTQIEKLQKEKEALEAENGLLMLEIKKLTARANLTPEELRDAIEKDKELADAATAAAALLSSCAT